MMGILPPGLAKYLAGKKKGKTLGAAGYPTNTPAPPPFGQPSSLHYGSMHGVTNGMAMITEPTGKKIDIRKVVKKHKVMKGK